MDAIERLGEAARGAIDSGSPPRLVVAVISTNHRGRLARLQRLFATRFLEAHQEMRINPASRHARARCRRAKCTLDLIRARIASIGVARPDELQLLDWAREADLPRLVANRNAA